MATTSPCESHHPHKGIQVTYWAVPWVMLTAVGKTTMYRPAADGFPEVLPAVHGPITSGPVSKEHYV